jgi:hypothetical protein
VNDVSGNSLSCYYTIPDLRTKYATPTYIIELKPIECRNSESDASELRKYLEPFNGVLRMPDKLDVSDIDFDCKKIDFSGKKF